MASGFRVARDEGTLYVQASGLANMKNAPLLDALFQSETGLDLHMVCVDLAQCTGMDSTFMGLLVGTSSTMKANGHRLVVLNPSELCTKLLDMLGVSEVVPVLAHVHAPEVTFVDLGEASVPVGAIQRMEVIRRAHHALASVNEANHAQFAGFITALEADLARLK